MSQENGDALGAFKGNIAALAQQELDKIDVEMQEVGMRLDALRDQRRSVRAILSATRPPRVRDRKKQPSKAAVPFKMSDERREAFERWLGEHGAQEFTTRTVKDAFPDWADSYANMTVKLLREEGVIRKAAQSGSTTIYKAIA